MATRFVERIAVESDAPPGGGEAVLLIHGLGGTSNTWTPLLPALARRRRRRPHGKSGNRQLASRPQ